MNLLNNLTGKTKLLEEIFKLNGQLDLHRLEIRDKEQEIRILLQKNNHAKTELSKLKVDVIEKRKSLAVLEIEFTSMVEGYELKLNEQYEEISLLKKTNKETIKATTLLKKDAMEKGKLLESFKKSFGELRIEEEQNQSSLSDYDEDKSFFDFMKSKNENNDFNNDQVNAIRYNMEKHLRIIAGAGSGKTQTICAKAAYLVMMKNIPQDKIAMITFTTKAAEEMKERVQHFLEEGKPKLSIGTFHSIFQAMYKELKVKFPYVNSIGINGEDPVRGEKQYRNILNNLIKKYKLTVLNDDGEKTIIEKVSYWTNMGFTFENMTKFIKNHYDQLEPLSEVPISERFFSMMNEFQNLRTDKNIVIFDDYLLNLLYVLQEDEEARTYIQQRFQYIFIDEFQDTNPLQMKIINLICPPENDGIAKLIIVGDDDQSIYFFRGAEPKYIKEFDQVYLTHTQTLMTNYRSIASIVQAGNRVISHNSSNRIPKTMEPFHNNYGECFIKELSNPEEEADWIITKAKELGIKTTKGIQLPVPDYKKSVVLYRSSTQLKTMLHQLEVNNIPFVIETNEDLMGIFNIDLFKQAFKYWSSFLNAEVNKISEWNNILTQTAYAFYKKRGDVAEFITDKNKYIDPIDAAEFICKKNNDDKKNIVINYLTDLIELKRKKQVSMENIIKGLLKFPLFENQLTKEEIKWIEFEARNFGSWEHMINRHKDLKIKKEKMAKKLKEYHQKIYNAIYLLTIHRSKGLAFENVFLIGVHNEGLPNKRAIKFDSKLLQALIEQAEPPTTIDEERRLMYVAVTRPKKNLYITFPTTINDKPIKRSIFLKEIELPIKK